MGCVWVCDGWLEKMFSFWGSLVYRHVAKVMIISLLIAGVLIAGMYRLETEERVDHLWVYDKGWALPERKTYEDNFDEGWRRSYSIYESKSGENIFETSVLLSLWDRYNATLSMITHTKNDTTGEKITVNYEDICYRICEDDCPCRTFSVLELWGYNQERIMNDPFPLRTLSLNLVGISYDETISDYVTGPNEEILSVRVIRDTFYIMREEVDVGTETKETVAEDWEEDWWDMITDPSWDEKDGPFTRYSYTLERVYEEKDTVRSEDTLLIIPGAVLMLIYSCTMMGQMTLLHSKVLVSLAGFLSIGLSVMAAFGFGGWVGKPDNSVVGILPFILLGIGVDDMFILTTELHRLKDEHEDDDDEKKKDDHFLFSEMMKRAGVSITVTSLTDVAAFSTLLLSNIPAIRTFGFYAAMGILFDYLLQLSFWSSILALDLRRQKANRADMVPCVKLDPELSKERLKKAQKRELGPRMFRKYANLVRRPPFQVAVFFVFAGFIGAAIYGCVVLEVTNVPASFFESDTKVTYEKYDKYFANQVGETIYAVTEEFDYYTYSPLLTELQANLTENIYIDEVYFSWYDAYQYWVLLEKVNVTTEDEFYCSVAMFLESDFGILWRNDVVWGVVEGCHPNASIIATRLPSLSVPLSDYRIQFAIKAMNSIRSTTNDFPFPSFSFSFSYRFWYTSENLPKELGLAMGIGLAIMLVILFLFLHDPLMTLLCWLMVGLTIFCLLGWTFMWDLGIDFPVLMNVIFSIGLSVDFSVHMCICFLATPKTNPDRMKSAMIRIGPAILNGAFSTFLAVVMLAGAQSFAFQTFFRLIATTIFFGLFFGLMFLPVILALISSPPRYPATTAAEREEENDKKKDELGGDEGGGGLVNY